METEDYKNVEKCVKKEQKNKNYVCYNEIFEIDISIIIKVIKKCKCKCVKEIKENTKEYKNNKKQNKKLYLTMI